jgi:hypothetical protein
VAFCFRRRATYEMGALEPVERFEAVLVRFVEGAMGLLGPVEVVDVVAFDRVRRELADWTEYEELWEYAEAGYCADVRLRFCIAVFMFVARFGV